MTRIPGENVGTYAITPSGAVNANYTITFAAGNLSITKAPLSVLAAAQTKVYGSADPSLSYAVTGLKRGDTSTIALSGSLTRSAGESVAAGPYAITQGSLAANGNYTLNFAGNALAITPAALSISANDATKVYGDADPTFSAAYSGLANGDTSAAIAGTLLTRIPGENVGTYATTPSGAVNANYTITFAAGNLSITKAPLSVVAAAQTKVYGSADPSLTFAITGLKRGETSTIALSGSLTRTAGESVTAGPYAITQGSLAPNGNYTLSFTGNALTITPAALSISANDATKVYGDADPTFSAAYSGLANGDTSAAIAGTLLTRIPGENVGTYAITPSGAVSANYTITLAAGNLSITKAPLSVLAAAQTKVYGSADPSLTYAVTGLKRGDTSTIALNGSLTRAAGENVSGSPYAITQGSLAANGNYTLGFASGALAITPAALSITANSTNKLHGTSDPQFTAAYAGFVNGETASALSGALQFSRAPGEGVGSYPVTPGGVTNSNYAISFLDGILTIGATAPTMSHPAVFADHIVITWAALSNAVYRVQFKPDLNAASWTDLEGDVRATSGTCSKTNSVASEGFYRVQVLP